MNSQTFQPAAHRQITRRQMIKLAGVAAAGSVIATRSLAQDVMEKPGARPFEYRLLLGWIKDK